MTYVYKCVRCGLEFALYLKNPQTEDVPFPPCSDCGALNSELLDFDADGSKLEFLHWEIEKLRGRIERLEELFETGEEGRRMEKELIN